MTSTSSRSSIQTPTGSRNSLTNHPIVYDIDDSFNDSYLDEITEESNQIYLKNQANMKDLKLSHQPHSQAPGSPGLKKSGSRGSITSSGPVKMVKKYIPTPNGIKIVEVPEANLAQEIARNNSIRSGTNIPRSGSLRGISNQNKKISRTSSLNSISNKTKPAPRMSSLVRSPPKMAPMRENVNLEAKLGNEDDKLEQKLKMEALQKEIDHEKQLAHELELKKKEYESLREARLQNEKRLLQLEKEEEQKVAAQTAANDYPEPDLDTVTDNAGKNVSEQANQVSNYPSIKVDDNDLETSEETIVKDYIEKPSLTTIEVNPDDAITPDNDSLVEQNNLHGDVIKSFGEEKKPATELYSSDSEIDKDYRSLEPGKLGTEIGIINQYSHLQSNELLKRDSIVESDNITADESEQEYQSDLAKRLRPQFADASQTNPDEFVQNEHEIPERKDLTSIVLPSSSPEAEPEPVPTTVAQSEETLHVPTISGQESSAASSLYSGNSEDGKKKLKSAMKNSSSFYNVSTTPSNSNTAAKSNAAHQAYLSLTTAENTRLNSKMSASQLGEYTSVAGNGAYPQINAAQNQKRLSQSLRKQPKQQQPPPSMAGRSLRPQSMQAESGHGKYAAAYESQQNGISGRNLRDNRQTVYVQPMAAHPALQPNYQSPSKMKAAELYAKANSRPMSVFKPVVKKSSFSKESTREEIAPQPKRLGKTSRTTLRDSAYNVPPPQQQHSHAPPQNNILHRATHPQQQNTPSGLRKPAENNNPGIFKSRFVDSDDEDHHHGGGGFKAFKSRFNDSDDALHILPKLATTAISSDDTPTLRNGGRNRDTSGISNVSAATASSSKEKKKFGGKLRKLFGRSDN